ncbi:MAG TPA: cyclic nucleotide-binding domain-containing protein [Acidimicrobiia bacterium]|nr:cyclic nucleotide-binding domain-containing protein [Acidimicrobiia bacterium]
MEVTLLDSIPILARLPMEQRAWIAAHASETFVPIGSHLVKGGDIAYRFFAILEGTAVVSRDQKPVASLLPGDVFGEMALLDDTPRNADVVAATAMRIITMMSWDFREALGLFPEFAGEVARVTSSRADAAGG